MPYLIQSNFSKIIKEQINTTAILSRVYINPYTFEIGLYNLLIQDDKNKTLLYFKSLQTNVEFTKLLFSQIELSYIHINSLKTAITLYKNNEFNFSHILKQLEQNKKIKEEPKEIQKKENNPLLFTLNELLLKDARLIFNDQTKSKNFEITTKPFNFEIKNFSTKENSVAKINTNIEIVDTLNLNLQSNVLLSPTKIDGKISFQDIQLQKIYSYLEDDLKFQFKGLVKNISTTFNANLKNNEIKAELQNLNVNIPYINYNDTKFNLTSEDLNSSIKNIKITKNSLLTFETNEILVSNKNIEFTDLLKNQKNHLNFKDLDIKIDKFSSDKKQENKISLFIKTPTSGNIDINVNTLQEPLTVKGMATIKKLNIVPYKDYIKDFINIDVKKTLVDINSKLQIKGSAQNVQADITISKIDLFHDITKKRLLKIKKVKIDGLKYTNNNLFIENVILDTFSTSFKIDANKKTNIDGLIVTKKDKESNAKKNKKSNFNYYVKNLKIANGKAAFSDHSLPLNFDTNIHSLNALVNDLSSKNEEASIKLNGVIEKYGLANIEAKTILSNFKNKTDVSIKFQNLDVRSFSPYSGKFIGQKIADGRLWLDLNYNISNAQLSSTNNIKLKNLTLGEDVNSTDAMSLPVGLAIALLEDSDGLIDLDVPVVGNMDQPQFELGGVIWKTLGNVITNIVTAPFRFLGSLLGMDSDELGTVEFNFAEAEVLPPQKEKLDKLIQALQKKKNLLITLQPTVNILNDSKILKEKRFLILIKSEDRNKTIKKLYEKRFGEDKLDDLASKHKKEELISILSQEIKTTILISKEDLDALAKQRADNIKTYFLSNKLRLDRIQIKNDVFENKDNDTKELSLKLELNIKD